MKNLIKRNKFTILLGLILAIIFAIIIVLSQREESDFTLTPAKRDEGFQVITETTTDTQNDIQNTNNPQDVPAQDEINPEDVDNTGTADYVEPIGDIDELINGLDPVTIEFTEANGFSPSNTEGVEGQRLLWINNTGRIIKITQIIDKYESLPQEVEIGPGQTYGISLTEIGDWSYRESQTGLIGRIFVYKKPQVKK